MVEYSLLDELKAAAFEVLHLNPGSEFGDWQQELVQNYGMEVVDCYGVNPEEALAGLADLWESDYLDEATGIEHTFAQWATIFCNEEVADFYHACAELIDKLKPK